MDKVKYHLDGDFPQELPPSQAYLLGGMFIAWCALNNLLSIQMLLDFQYECEDLVSRKKSPCSLYTSLGGVFLSSHLKDQGFYFAKFYFDFEEGVYIDDFIEILASELSSAYDVIDNWENYDNISKKIDQRFENWKHDMR